MEENKNTTTEEITETVNETVKSEATLDEECTGIPELQDIPASEIIVNFKHKEPILKVRQEQYEELLKSKIVLDLTIKLHKAYDDTYDFSRLFKKLLAVCYPDIEKGEKGGK